VREGHEQQRASSERNEYQRNRKVNRVACHPRTIPVFGTELHPVRWWSDVDAGIDRTYVSRLERGLENPSVALLEKLAIALNAAIPDLFAPPAKGEPLPRPLKAGRRARK
jgi:hypothetical protein